MLASRFTLLPYDIHMIDPPNPQTPTHTLRYLDQVLALEDEVKAAGALKKAVEQYKERALELERERFKAVESVQVR